MPDYAGGLRFFPNSVLRSGKKASGHIASGNAGTVRWLHEYTNGTLVSGGIGKVAPGVPADGNIPGHDHSGGLMGNPMTHTVWSMPYGRQNGANTGTDTVHEGPHTYLSATTGRPAIEYIPVSGWSYCRVFIPPGKAYEYLTPEFLLYSVDFDIDVLCIILAPNGRQYAANVGSTYETITNNTENQFIAFDEPVPFWPGKIQTFGWRVAFDNTGGGGDPDVAVLSVALHQTSTTP